MDFVQDRTTDGDPGCTGARGVRVEALGEGSAPPIEGPIEGGIASMIRRT